MPFSHAIHKLPDSTEELKGKDILSPATYFMPGICPIEMMIQNALCEQAPTVILYIYFCMAELLFTVYHNFCASSIMQNHNRQTLRADISLQSDNR